MKSLFQSATAMQSSTSLPSREKTNNLDVEFVDTKISHIKEQHEWKQLSNTSQEESGFEAPMSTSRMMSLVAMAFLWTGSQIPLWLFSGIPIYIYRDIGGQDRGSWYIVGNLLALTAVCPFTGTLSDLIGRRYIALAGASFIVIGMVVCSSAPNMNAFIAGMTLAGVGAGLNELTALAVASELAPAAKRGKYIAVIIFSIVPFCPSFLYAQMIASHSSWRYVGLLCGLWEFIGLAITFIFYHPPPRPNSEGLTRREILSQIDFVGGFLSIVGTLLFVCGLYWGGYQYTWRSAHVLVPLLLGAALLIAFPFWEIYGAKYPMFPSRLKNEPRILILTLLITFISGANFFSILSFWPLQASNVYGHSPLGVGLRVLPINFSILFGSIIALLALTYFRGGLRAIMIISSVLMTGGCGAMSLSTVDNLPLMYGIVTIACLGIGGTFVPMTVITTLICPDDLIATVAALTLAIRVLGGAVGYTIYLNVLLERLSVSVVTRLSPVLFKNQIFDPDTIRSVIALTKTGLTENILHLPGLKGNVTIWREIVLEGQVAYSEAYPYVYYISVGFGFVSIIASCFLGNIEKYMDNHVAVVMK